MANTIIIGAGMTGISCARMLAAAGHGVLVVDKGRQIGGRMATRRIAIDSGKVCFDHGAQSFTVRGLGFATMLAGLQGTVADWGDGTGRVRHVGRPGMSSLPHTMATDVQVHQDTEVTALDRTEDGWRVMTGAGPITAARVVLTVPAPQVQTLIGPDHPLTVLLAEVVMSPCLALMAAFPHDAPTPFISRTFHVGPLWRITRDSSKPGRCSAATTWVAQASPHWSAAHLEEDKTTVVERLLPLLCDAIGTTPQNAVYTAAHRWRFASVTMPLGRPFLRDGTNTLYLGGDWCLGARVEAAWESGTAIARDILA